MSLQSFSLERGLPKLEALALLVFGDDTSKTCLDKGLHGCVLLPGDPARFLEKAIRYLYGCLHMGNHIIRYGGMSRTTFFDRSSERPSMAQRPELTGARLPAEKGMIYVQAAVGGAGRPRRGRVRDA